MGSHSVTCYPTQVNTPHLNPNQTGLYSIDLPRRDGRLSLPRWLVTYRDVFTRPQMVTHPSSNRAQCRLTTLIKANALTTTQCRLVFIFSLKRWPSCTYFVHFTDGVPSKVHYAKTRGGSRHQKTRRPHLIGQNWGLVMAARSSLPRTLRWTITEILNFWHQLFDSLIMIIIMNALKYNGCVLFHNLTNLDRSERNTLRSFSPDCVDLVLI